MAYRPSIVAVEIEIVEEEAPEEIERALARLSEGGVEVVVVSSAGVSEIRRRLEAAGAGTGIDRLESVGDQVRSLGERAAWPTLLHRLGVTAEQLGVVVRGEEVARAARGSGVTTALVHRPPKHFVHAPGPADVRGESLGAVVAQLLDLPRPLIRPPAGT